MSFIKRILEKYPLELGGKVDINTLANLSERIGENQFFFQKRGRRDSIEKLYLICENLTERSLKAFLDDFKNFFTERPFDVNTMFESIKAVNSFSHCFERINDVLCTCNFSSFDGKYIVTISIFRS